MTDTLLRAIIADDEPLAIEGIRRFCEAHPSIEVVGEATDGTAALALVDELQPELLFLDISMPGLGGLETAAALRNRERAPHVVLVTAHDNFATEAYDLAVVDYVLKPVLPDRLSRAIERVSVLARAEARAEQPREFWVPYRGSVVRLAEEDILRVDAERDYVRIVAADRSFLLRATLTDMESRLPTEEFIRVHRSTILRIRRVTAVRHVNAGAWVAIEEDGVEHSIGRRYLDTVRTRLGVT